jgi:serine/threonine-protein kinase
VLLGVAGGAAIGYYAWKHVDTTPASPPSVEKIRQFVEQYNGGECFFITPVGIGETAATLEGLGISTRPFEALDAAFRREHGFEPSIGVRQVTPAQCPAITFLGRLRGERAPRLQIDSVRLRNGETLSGIVEGFGSRNVELLLVSEGGLVQNVSQRLRPGIDAKTFSFETRREALSGSQPQLLVAIATREPFESLRPSSPGEAGQFFTAVLAEAARTRQVVSAAARYFKLEN